MNIKIKDILVSIQKELEENLQLKEPFLIPIMMRYVNFICIQYTSFLYKKNRYYNHLNLLQYLFFFNYIKINPILENRIVHNWNEVFSIIDIILFILRIY